MPPAGGRASRLAASAATAFRAYAAWLIGISWKRFAVLAVLLLILAEMLQQVPPFSWRVSEELRERPLVVVAPPAPPLPPSSPQVPRPARVQVGPPGAPDSVQIDIGRDGVKVLRGGATAASQAAAGAPSPSASDIEAAARTAADAIVAKLPALAASGADGRAPDADEVRDAVREARDDIAEAIRDAAEAAQEAANAAREGSARTRVRTVRFGDFLPDLALLWIVGSAILKLTYAGRVRAEVQAAQATETAEAESLKRQVIEARMAAMQAQVEPHFLFNTLASIDHLIETDPPRASVMQKNLIALLRASMPTMREASTGGVRELGRELAVIRPYLEILKVRMEDRLQTAIEVPDGLLSAEFPPMMIQGLVENAIKHGLEPKPEGGRLLVRAEIMHGKLAVTVADTGLGFGRAATAGTGVGLANLRERLQLLYGGKAALDIRENTPSGTIVTVTVPYRARTDA